MIYIFDLDGTLCDLTHRLHLLPKNLPDHRRRSDSWRDFEEQCWRDKGILAVLNILQALWVGGHVVYICTARHDFTRDMTIDWLHQHMPSIPREWWGSAVDTRLFMRPAGDRRKDVELKRDWLNTRFAKGGFDRQQIACVFEDRQRVVDMWREEGLQCLQVAPGNF